MNVAHIERVSFPVGRARRSGTPDPYTMPCRLCFNGLPAITRNQWGRYGCAGWGGVYILTKPWYEKYTGARVLKACWRPIRLWARYSSSAPSHFEWPQSTYECQTSRYRYKGSRAPTAKRMTFLTEKHVK